MTQSTSRLVIEISAEHARRNAEMLSRELQNIERNGTYATTSMDSMSVAARKLAGHLTALVTIGSGIEKLDLYTNLENRLKLVTNSQIELNRATEDTFKIAQKTGAAWDSTAQIYQRFANNSKALGLSMKHTAQLTETVSKAVAISGTSTQAAEAALTQFSQSLNSGTLKGEELNSVLEQTPGLAQAIAEGLGITVGQLKTVAATGAITSQALVKALDKAKGSVDNLFSKTDFTIGQSLTMLNNELTKFVGEASKGSGATKAISESVQTLAKNLETVTDVLMIGGAYYAGTYIPTIYKSVAAQANKITSTIAQINAEKLANEITAQRTSRTLQLTQVEVANATAQASRLSGMAKLAYVEKTLIPLQQAETVAKEADTVAQNANNAAKITATRLGKGLLSVLGGPAGLAGMAVAVGASMLLMRDNTDEATQSLAEQKKAVGELADEYSRMSAAKLIGEMDKLKKESEKAKDAMADNLKDAQATIQISGTDEVNVKRYNDLREILRQVKDEGKLTQDALQDLQKLGFTDEQIKNVQRYLALFEDNKNVTRSKVYQLEMANSYLAKETGLYEKNATQAEKYRVELDQVNKSYESKNKLLQDDAELTIRTSENQGTSTKQLDIARIALEKYSKGQIKASDLAIILNKNLKISPESIKSFGDQAKEADKLKDKQTDLNKQLEETNKVQAEYEKKHQSYLSKVNEQTEATQAQALAQENLNKAIRESVKKNVDEQDYFVKKVKSGGGNKDAVDRAKAEVDWRKSNKLVDWAKDLSTEQEALFRQEYDAQKRTSDLQDTINKKEEKRTKELKKQAEIRAKTVNSRTIDAVIAKGEGNYNSYNRGKAGDSMGNPLGLNLQNMTVAQVRALQDKDRKKGGIFAVGKYQAVPETLQGAIDSGVIKQSERFTAELQERIVRGYLFTAKKGRKSVEDYITGKSDNLTAAQVDLSKEFASVENPLTGKSYHAGKGGNKASISAKQVADGLKASRELNLRAIAEGKSAKQAWQEAFNKSISFVDGSQQQKDLLENVKEYENLEKKRADIRKLYDSKELKDLADHTQKLKDIQESFGDSDEGKKLTDAENKRFEAQKELNDLKREYDLKSFKMTEDQKLVYSIRIQQKEIEANTELRDTEKAKALDVLKYKFNYELTQIDLLKRERLLAAQEAAGKENEFILARYKLERDKLKEIKDVSEDELQIRRALLEQQQAKALRKDVEEHAKEYSEIKRTLAGRDYDDKFRPVYDTTRDQTKKNKEFKDSRLNSVNNDESQRTEDVQSLYDQQLISLQEFEDAKTEIARQASEQRAQIEQESQETQQQINDRSQKLMLQSSIDTYESMFGSVTSIMADAFGKQSSAYKAAFTVQKAFAIASIGLKIPEALANAMADTPYPLNLAAYAQVAGLTASLVSQVASVGAEGFKTGGYTGDGGVNDVAGVVHGKEFVLTAEATRRVGVNTLNAINNGADIRATQQAQQTATAIAPQINNVVQSGGANVSNYNFIDPVEMYKHAMSTPEGTKVLINSISENSTAVKRATQ